MSEHPILFSAPMIRALLDNRKFVTRRLSKRWLKVKAGDRLWVRETWAPYDGDLAAYLADYPDSLAPWHPKNEFRRWKPSIHMPRRFSRILLECEEDAREERLQDITEEEARMEGVEGISSIGPCRAMGYRDYGGGPGFMQAVQSFASLWKTLHTKPGERWSDNPTVVRVGRFRRATPTGGPRV